MRIFIADHESKVRFALRALLLRRPGLEVVGEADTVEALLAQVGAAQPDLLLLHWRLGERMPELLTDLKRACPEMGVIVLSVRQEICGEALAAGAEAFVCKMDPPDKLLAAIELVRARRCGQWGKRCEGSLRQSSAEGKRAEGEGLKILRFGSPNPRLASQSGD